MSTANRRLATGATRVPAAPAKKEAALQPVMRSARGEEAGIPKRVARVEIMAEDIDASAEEFIKRFRENLLLQRLESIENYKEMLARGV